MAEWLEARETARRHSRLALRTTPGSIPARCSAKARVHRGPGVQGVPRSVASHRKYHFVEWSIDGTIFFSISQTKILISQTEILNEVVLIVSLFLSISQTKIIIYKSAIGMEQSYIFYIVNLNCWYYYQTHSLNVIQIKEMYCRTKVCNSQTERHSAVVIISWICL